MQNRASRIIGTYDIFGKSIPGAALVIGSLLLLPIQNLLDRNETITIDLGGSIASVTLAIVLILISGLIIGQGVHSLADIIEKIFAWALYRTIKIVRSVRKFDRNYVDGWIARNYIRLGLALIIALVVSLIGMVVYNFALYLSALLFALSTYAIGWIYQTYVGVLLPLISFSSREENEPSNEGSTDSVDVGENNGESDEMDKEEFEEALGVDTESDELKIPDRTFESDTGIGLEEQMRQWVSRHAWGIYDSFVDHRRLFDRYLRWNFDDYFTDRYDDVEQVALNFRSNCDEFKGTADIGQLYATVNGRVRNRGGTRVQDFQNTYSFCRSMWVVFLLLGIMYQTISHYPEFFKTFLEFTPSLLSFNISEHQIDILSSVLVLISAVFLSATGTYKRHYIEYLLVAHYLLMKEENDNDEENIRLAHQLVSGNNEGSSDK
jgi:hypothetical protein